MDRVIMIKYGELSTKKANRNFFINTLYHNVLYKYIGFIKMDTNERSQYRARESRKVYVNTKSVFLKIEFDRNYMNQYILFGIFYPLFP